VIRLKKMRWYLF